MSRKTEIQVGLTVLLALAILVLGVSWLKEFSFQRTVRVWHVRFDQTGGLGASDEVQVNGIRKGEVRAMELVGNHVVIDLALASDVVLTRDSRVSIRNVGMMGEKVIAVDLETTGGAYTERDTILGLFENGLPEVMAELGGAVGSISGMAEQLRGMTESMDKNGDLTGAIKNFRVTSELLRQTVEENRAGLKRTVEDFSSAAATARGLTTDREVELKRTLEQFSRAADNMERLSGRLDSLRASIQAVTSHVESGQGTLGRLVKDDKLYTELSDSIRSLKALIEDIKANPKKYVKLSLF